MNNKVKCFFFFTLLFFCIACNNNSDTKKQLATDSLIKGNSAYDANFLKKHTRKIIELKSEDGNAKILLSADYQGRVMMSTANGDSGTSYGWINYDLIAPRERKKQFNPVGGEERFWMCPEGGQYSVYCINIKPRKRNNALNQTCHEKKSTCPFFYPVISTWYYANQNHYT